MSMARQAKMADLLAPGLVLAAVIVAGVGFSLTIISGPRALEQVSFQITDTGATVSVDFRDEPLGAFVMAFEYDGTFEGVIPHRGFDINSSAGDGELMVIGYNLEGSQGTDMALFDLRIADLEVLRLTGATLAGLGEEGIGFGIRLSIIPEEYPGVGDVTGDGVTTLADALQVIRYVDGFRTFTEAQLLEADVNSDGIINRIDADLIGAYELDVPRLIQLPIYNLIVLTEPTGSGRVTFSPTRSVPPRAYLDPLIRDGEYETGTAVLVAATPITATFQGWSGGASGTSPTTTLVMDSNKVVIARFGVSAPPDDDGGEVIEEEGEFTFIVDPCAYGITAGELNAAMVLDTPDEQFLIEELATQTIISGVCEYTFTWTLTEARRNTLPDGDILFKWRALGFAGQDSGFIETFATTVAISPFAVIEDFVEENQILLLVGGSLAIFAVFAVIVVVRRGRQRMPMVQG